MSRFASPVGTEGIDGDVPHVRTPVPSQDLLPTPASALQEIGGYGKASRPPVPASARLHLQMPCGDPAMAAGWVGGAPDLPEDTAWPTLKGRDQVFLLQLDCARLPSDLWQGQGPRAGWLSVFADPETAQATVLHSATRGTPRVGPPLASAHWFRPDDHVDVGTCRSDLRQLGLAAWPVTLRRVAQGQVAPVPRHPMFASSHPTAPAAFDLAAPGHRPFDWPTTFSALHAVAQMLQWHLARWQRNTANLPRDRAILSVLIKRLRSELTGVQDLTAAAGAAATETEFSDDLWSLLCEGLEALAVPTVRRLPAADAQARGQTFELTAPTPVLSTMTTHFWQPYRRFVRSYAAQAHVTGKPLPPAVHDAFAPEWTRIAQTEPLGLGNQPAALNMALRSPDMQVLFDIPSSDFFGWCWGIDMENLVICLPKADLAAARFDRAITRILC